VKHAIQKRLAAAERAAASLVVDPDAEPSPIGISRGEYQALWIEWATSQSHISQDEIAVVVDALAYEVLHRPVLREIQVVVEVLEKHHAEVSAITGRSKQTSGPQIGATH
jgi:hypothetical protein